MGGRGSTPGTAILGNNPGGVCPLSSPDVVVLEGATLLPGVDIVGFPTAGNCSLCSPSKPMSSSSIFKILIADYDHTERKS